MTLKEKIAVMQAADDGKKIQVSLKGEANWFGIDAPAWNWDRFDYRVKPKTLELWVNVYPNGLSAYYDTKELADKFANSDRLRCVHMREVVE